jgi:hypothetical protein
MLMGPRGRSIFAGRRKLVFYSFSLDRVGSGKCFVDLRGLEDNEDWFEYRFGGILGSTVKRLVGSTLIDRFGDYARDIKDFLENKIVDGEGSREAVGGDWAAMVSAMQSTAQTKSHLLGN